MPTDDSRQGERVPAAMRIKLKYPDVETFIQRYSVNISRGGIFIATRTPKPVGTVVRFEFQLASAAPIIRGEGQVIWIKPFDPEQPRRVHGMGVRFTRLDAESRQLIDRALQYKKEHEAADKEGDAPRELGDDLVETSGGVPVPESGESPRPGSVASLPPASMTPRDSGPFARVEEEGAAELPPPPLPPAPRPRAPAAPPRVSTAGATAPMSTIPPISGTATTSKNALITSAGPAAHQDAAEPGALPSLDEQREIIAELAQSTQSQVVRAAHHIAEITAGHNFFPEDTVLQELLRPLRIPMPDSGREAAKLLRELLRGA